MNNNKEELYELSLTKEEMKDYLISKNKVNNFNIGDYVVCLIPDKSHFKKEEVFIVVDNGKNGIINHIGVTNINVNNYSLHFSFFRHATEEEIKNYKIIHKIYNISVKYNDNGVEKIHEVKFYKGHILIGRKSFYNECIIEIFNNYLAFRSTLRKYEIELKGFTIDGVNIISNEDFVKIFNNLKYV